MENSVLKTNNSLKCGFAIKLLSVIALVCTVLSCSSYFSYYVEINGEWVLKFYFPYFKFYFPYFLDLIPLLITLAPCVLLLFVIYIFKFHNELKATILVPIIFGLYPLEMILDNVFGAGGYIIWLIIGFSILVMCILAVISALKGFDNKLFLIIPMSLCLLYNALLLIAYLPGLFNARGIWSINYLLPHAMCIFASISALKGFTSFTSKLFVIISMWLCLLKNALSLIDSFLDIGYYIERSRYFYFFTDLLSIIGSTLLGISLLLFVLKNKIPSVIEHFFEKKREKVGKMNPKRALKLLQDKLELGMITEEEYKAQRAEIISKL